MDVLENPSNKAQVSVSIRKFILHKGLSSAVNAANLLAANPTSLNTPEFTLEKSLTNVGNVENPLAKVQVSFNTREFTLEKGL